VTINKYIDTGHYNIPNVRHELDKIIDYPIYIDIDLTNAFHQIRLDPETAMKLSIQTPWGQYQPRFMPEGIGPGSFVLQETVRTLFGDFDWAVIIFDNVLILAKDFQDAYDKLDTFLDRCIKHKVVLKFSKSWLGYTEVNFFGYRCEHKSFCSHRRSQESCPGDTISSGWQQEQEDTSHPGGGSILLSFH